MDEKVVLNFLNEELAKTEDHTCFWQDICGFLKNATEKYKEELQRNEKQGLIEEHTWECLETIRNFEKQVLLLVLISDLEREHSVLEKEINEQQEQMETLNKKIDGSKEYISSLEKKNQVTDKRTQNKLRENVKVARDRLRMINELMNKTDITSPKGVKETQEKVANAVETITLILEKNNLWPEQEEKPCELEERKIKAKRKKDDNSKKPLFPENKKKVKDD